MAAFFHDSDFDARLRRIFQSTKSQPSGKPRALSIEPSLMADAIADLYTAFSHRQLSKPFRYCDCCITEAMATCWATVHVRDLDASDLWAVMTNVPTTCGTAEDLLYFTPRILQHAATEDCALDLSWVYSALQEVKAVPTTETEAQCLHRFFELVWVSLRESDPLHPLGISGIVLPTAVLTGNIAHYLNLWLGTSAFRLYVKRFGNKDGTLCDAFWNPKERAYGQVISWLAEHCDEGILGTPELTPLYEKFLAYRRERGANALGE